ncbi:type II toxin-antitoxin system RelB/DinJ family antitoxin [Sulfurimonas sp. SAG-AH-194-I05]|nr:type II toxin-antitoxin system RelB/DinJ family antitoxin [Sulfurimonas sp. SAG-AH-194-I05]
MTKGLPFDIKLPNDETLKAMKEVEESKAYAKTL